MALKEMEGSWEWLRQLDVVWLMFYERRFYVFVPLLRYN